MKNRAIDKYRVWDEETKEYVSSRVFINHHGEACLIKNGCFYPNKTTKEHCTGKRDINGKLIYEGDVVLALESWSDRKREFNVIYCDKEYGFLFVDNSQNTKALFAFLPEELEIIGNIHEMELKK